MNIVYKAESKFVVIHTTENLKLNVHDCSLSLKLGKESFLINLLAPELFFLF